MLPTNVAQPLVIMMAIFVGFTAPITAPVNGGVKAAIGAEQKQANFAAWASSTTRHGRPGGDGRGFVAGADVAFRRRG